MNQSNRTVYSHDRTVGPDYTDKDILIYSKLDHNATLEMIQLSIELIRILLPDNRHAINTSHHMEKFRKYLETKS